jgi:hypothetical protein
MKEMPKNIYQSAEGNSLPFTLLLLLFHELLPGDESDRFLGLFVEFSHFFL